MICDNITLKFWGLFFMKRCILEIFFSLILIFSSYFIFNNEELDYYQKVIDSYDNVVAIDVSENFKNLEYLSTGISESKLTLNNINNNYKHINLIFNLSSSSDELINNLYLSVNGDLVKLTDVLEKQEGSDYSFLVDTYYLTSYEKKDLYLGLYLNDNYVMNDKDIINYNFVGEII